MDKINKIESNSERMPMREDIIAAMNMEGKEYEIVTELSDEKGLYKFEISTKENDGETTVYDYRRKGEFVNHQSPSSTIFVARYDKNGDFITYPEHIGEFNHETGEWTKV